MKNGFQDSRISPKTIERLSAFRRALADVSDVTQFVYSHDLAGMCGSTAAQVRRDLMVIGTTGCPRRGYSVRDLIDHIDEFFTRVEMHKVALVGLGNLGKSLIGYFQQRVHRLSIAAIFDRDPEKTGRVVHGIRSYSMEELPEVVSRLGISIAVLALPDASAQEVAEKLAAAGVTGILNFAPVTLRMPESTSVENIDISVALDKLAFFARKNPESTTHSEEVMKCSN